METEPARSAPPPDLLGDPGTFIGRMWNRAAAYPLRTLFLVVAAQTVPALWSRDLTFFDEVRHGDALRNLLEDGHWLVLHMNGEPYPDKPPLWFWLVAGFAKVLGAGPPAFFAASALSGWLFLVATYALARRALGVAAGPALAAALMVFASPLFLVFGLSTRMDLLFSALIVLSEVCLFRGLTRDERSPWTVLGLALAGVATLVKGPLGIALPLLAAAAWLAWRGRVGRLARWDVLAGLAACAALVGGWVLAARAVEGEAFVRGMFGGQVLDRTLAAGKNAGPIWFYVVVIPALWLPWTLVGAGAPPRRAFSPAAWREAWRGRRAADAGRSFLWIAVASGFVLLTAVSTKLSRYQMPLYAPIAVLTVETWRRLEPGAARRAWGAVGALFLAAAAAIPFVDRIVHASLDWPVSVAGLWPAAAVAAGTGVAAIALRGKPLHRGLRAVVLGTIAFSLVLSLVTWPSIEPVVSPREQALVIADHARRGYEPMVYRTFPGTYAYHAGRSMFETDDPKQARAFLAAREKALLSTATKYADAARYPALAPLFEGMRLVHEQWLAEQTYGVWVKDGAP
jgi:4-amino-4-deoxy-L-arabinose transferase-like glycosyltransferase